MGIMISTLYSTSSAIIYNYTSITKQKTVAIVDGIESVVHISANTRPNSDGCGARIRFKNENGTVLASKLFPKQVSTSALTYDVPEYDYVEITVGPQNNGQWITGKVNYSFT